MAIVPASLRFELSVDGMDIQYSEVIEGAFFDEGASVSVVMVKAVKL